MSYLDDLDEIPPSKPIVDLFTQYYNFTTNSNFENLDLNPESVENGNEEQQPNPSSSEYYQADRSIDENQLELPADIQPPPPSKDDKLEMPTTNNVETEKRKRKASRKVEEDSDDFDEEMPKPKNGKKSKYIKVDSNIPRIIKIRGINLCGQTKKCFKCDRLFDKNHLFIYSEDKSLDVDDKPYICLGCSLYVNDDLMLRDWDTNLQNPFKCYRCNHERSSARRTKVGSYCSYCSLKKKRSYLLRI